MNPTDYELICPKDGEELVDGKCLKCGHHVITNVEACTDDDIKRFKENVAGPDNGWFDGFTVGSIKALLARLAAAEDLADHGACPDGATEYPCRLRTKWLKTRGIGV